MSVRSGVVYLVGAGPGDPGLITVARDRADRGCRRDRLRPADPRRGARRAPAPDAELVYVGKRPGTAGAGEECARPRRGRIEELMIERARAGSSVVRLKGGDPFVFGRGGEEAEALRAAGVEFEVVPGSPPGSPRPRTRASRSPTARTRPRSRSSPATRTPTSPRARSTGTRSRRSRARSSSTWASSASARSPRALIDAGRDAAEPAAAIERGTLPGQRAVVGDARRSAARPRTAPGSARPAVDRRSARSRRGASTIAWLERAPAARPPRRRHPGARPGERTGARAARRSAPRSSSCRRSGSSRGSTPTRSAAPSTASTPTRSSA